MKYMGGKFRVRKALGELLNKNLDGRDYYEPFVGAAWVLGELNYPALKDGDSCFTEASFTQMPHST